MRVELYGIFRSPFRWGDCVLKFRDMGSTQKLDMNCPRETEADDAEKMWDFAYEWFCNRKLEAEK